MTNILILINPSFTALFYISRPLRVIAAALALILPLLAVAIPAHSGSETVVYKFNGQPTDGAYPAAGLSGDIAGNGYGTTQSGGVYGWGTVFKIKSGGPEIILHSFTGKADGSSPQAGVIQTTDGNIYGTTIEGGIALGYNGSGYGTVFKIAPSGQETVLHTFSGSTDGFYPSGLIQAKDGNFYGTTGGGVYGYGTVFRITSGGALTTLYSFTGGADGAGPASGVIQASDGNFYGTTQEDGIYKNGTVFRITSGGALTTVYAFTGGTDGTYPYGLVQAKDGAFYGATLFGGVYDLGTVFRITSTGQETLLYSFHGGSDGADPGAGVIQAKDGNLYGTTQDDGMYGWGTVYKITPGGQETVLHEFAGSTLGDGGTPMAPLVQDKTGYLYGTTYFGGISDNGTIFRMIL